MGTQYATGLERPDRWQWPRESVISKIPHRNPFICCRFFSFAKDGSSFPEV